MKCGVSSLLAIQLANAIGLVKCIKPARLVEGRRDWVLLVEGRGFVRLLMKEETPCAAIVAGSSLIPVPKMFVTEACALGFAQSVGLVPSQAQWAVASR